jgi:hypothetical protein
MHAAPSHAAHHQCQCHVSQNIHRTLLRRRRRRRDGDARRSGVGASVCDAQGAAPRDGDADQGRGQRAPCTHAHRGQQRRRERVGGGRPPGCVSSPALLLLYPRIVLTRTGKAGGDTASVTEMDDVVDGDDAATLVPHSPPDGAAAADGEVGVRARV